MSSVTNKSIIKPASSPILSQAGSSGKVKISSDHLPLPPLPKAKTSSEHLPLPPLPSLHKIRPLTSKVFSAKPSLPEKPSGSIIPPYPDDFYPEVSSSKSSKKVTKIGGFEIPKSQASEAEYDQFIFKTSNQIDGTHPLAANLIAFGDHHTDKSQRLWRSVLINHYAKEGDIVLIEGMDAFEVVSLRKNNSSLPFIAKKKIKCYGWDDPKQLAIGLESLSKNVQLLEKYSKTGPTHSYSDDLLTKEDQENRDNNIRNFERSSDARTVSMKHTVRTFLHQLKPGQKVFLIAGSAHLNGIFSGMELAKISVIIPKIFDGADTARSGYDYCKSLVAPASLVSKTN
jgi:hypothetical protein